MSKIWGWEDKKGAGEEGDENNIMTNKQKRRTGDKLQWPHTWTTWTRPDLKCFEEAHRTAPFATSRFYHRLCQHNSFWGLCFIWGGWYFEFWSRDLTNFKKLRKQKKTLQGSQSSETGCFQMLTWSHYCFLKLMLKNDGESQKQATEQFVS